MAAEIGIVETRTFIKYLKEQQGWDFSEFSITFLKRRLEHITTQLGIRDTDALIRKFTLDKTTFTQFLSDFIPCTTEMFRDPSVWRYLKEKILLEITENPPSPPKIWLASWDTGEDLYSLTILIKELNLLGKVKIFASEFSEDITKSIKEGLLDPKKMEVNHANYDRFQGKQELTSYYSQLPDGTVRFNSDLVKDVVFVKQNTNFGSSVSGCRLVLYRNQLIYMNISQEEKVIGNIRSSLIPGAYLVVGIKENLDHLAVGSSFQLVNSSEKVYKLKVG